MVKVMTQFLLAWICNEEMVVTELVAHLCICVVCGAECQKPGVGWMTAPPPHSAFGTHMSHVWLRGSSE
jgi:hypothetical protein